jgi:hypothetical protein
MCFQTHCDQARSSLWCRLLKYGHSAVGLLGPAGQRLPRSEAILLIQLAARGHLAAEFDAVRDFNVHGMALEVVTHFYCDALFVAASQAACPGCTSTAPQPAGV